MGKIRKHLGMPRPQFSKQNLVYGSAPKAGVHQLGPQPKPLPTAGEKSVLWSSPSCALMVTNTAAPAFPSPHRGKKIQVSQLQTLIWHHEISNVHRHLSFHVSPFPLCPTYAILLQICSPFTLQVITLSSVVKPHFLPSCYNSPVVVQINPKHTGSNKI